MRGQTRRVEAWRPADWLQRQGASYRFPNPVSVTGWRLSLAWPALRADCSSFGAAKHELVNLPFWTPSGRR